ncbi:MULTISPECIES: ATP-binding protein [unclassified Lactococcus]|uniref:DEAD/DEAH box helicase n=1 Tax=unclassified Lactococcus TaxID=2643510 RepID=UPI00164F805D|nr:MULTISPECIES: ATP-binding protein [unclassified Lactococcus]
MVSKNNILNSWITIEQFSEGNINVNENRNKKYKRLPNHSNDWLIFFQDKLSEFRYNQKNVNKKLQKRGFTIYFDVFSFDKLIQDLSKFFHLPEEYREESKTNKFTWCLTFMEDNGDFILLEDSIFLTISGYVHHYLNIPSDIFIENEELKNEMLEIFENNFNEGLSKLIKKESVLTKNNYYEIHEDVKNRKLYFHSFYINELDLAKKINSKNVDKYLLGFLGPRSNLDSDQLSTSFNKKDIYQILEPKEYPLGRFPSNPDWGLSLMQQIAVNTYLNGKDDVYGVNGPPGTGKTTLLKDIFADLAVRQAYEICYLEDKHLRRSNMYDMNVGIARLPDDISKYNILVASSNNAAVQNIVNELPQKMQIDETFLEDEVFSSYFSNIKDDDIWGVFASEGGNRTNMSNLLEIVSKISKELKSTLFISDKEIYSKFSKQYDLVNKMRQDAQKISDTIKQLDLLRNELINETRTFQNQLSYKKEKREQENITINRLIEGLDIEIGVLSTDFVKYEQITKDNRYKLEQLNLDLGILKQQRPLAFHILKLFHSKSVAIYIEQLSALTASISKIYKKQLSLDKEYNRKSQAYIMLKKSRAEHISFECNSKKIFEEWKKDNLKKIEDLSKKIRDLSTEINNSQFSPPDFTQTYSKFQQDNPWFDKKYRIEQSKLFILSMSVRKQFLYENQKSIAGSVEIWKNTSRYAIPEKKYLISLSWNWINLVVPVISTTFASFGQMFKYLGTNSIANLFIDEAGQATPQAAVGGIMRSKKIMAVGDPSQIQPVVSLSEGVIGLIATKYNALNNVVNGYASVQTLVDKASKFGYYKTENDWVGIPLWVHRRCKNPMFKISNEISYRNRMVLPESLNEPGRGEWFDIKGESDNKFVKEQADFLKEVLKKNLNIQEEGEENVFVISPFKNVVDTLKKDLRNIGFDQSRIGTVHTFQGKEADIVFLILGASSKEKRAAQWVISKPNIMNVAATRAKKEFYIIGDKELYLSLDCGVVTKTLEILKCY